MFNGFNHSYQPKDTAAALNPTAEQIRHARSGIDQKPTRDFHLPSSFRQPPIPPQNTAGEPNE